MSKKFKEIGFNQNIRTTVFFKHFKDLPLNQEYESSRYFGLFLAADATKMSNDLIYSYAYNAVKAGMAYLSVWGPDCKRLHDIFREVISFINANDNICTNEETEIMTASHHDESIEKTVYDFMKHEAPAKYYSDECKAAYVLSIGDKKQGRILKKVLKKAVRHL